MPFISISDKDISIYNDDGSLQQCIPFTAGAAVIRHAVIDALGNDVRLLAYCSCWGGIHTPAVIKEAFGRYAKFLSPGSKQHLKEWEERQRILSKLEADADKKQKKRVRQQT